MFTYAYVHVVINVYVCVCMCSGETSEHALFSMFFINICQKRVCDFLSIFLMFVNARDVQIKGQNLLRLLLVTLLVLGGII